MQQVDQRGWVRCGGAAKAGDETAGLALVHELLRIDVRERGNPEGGVADQLGEDSAGAEGDEWAENRVLDDAGQELGTTADHRLHEHRQPDPLDGGPDLPLVAQV